jgi:hypothetical protein
VYRVNQSATILSSARPFIRPAFHPPGLSSARPFIRPAFHPPGLSSARPFIRPAFRQIGDPLRAVDSVHRVETRSLKHAWNGIANSAYEGPAARGHGMTVV